MVRWFGFSINKNLFYLCHQQKSRQICFAAWHRAEPKRGGPSYGTFNLPFLHQVVPFTMWPNRNRDDPYAVWRRIDSPQEYEEIEMWARQQNERVFVRDGLLSTICLGRRMDDKNLCETHIGRLFHQAKYRGNHKSVDVLLDYCDAFLDEFEIYQRTNLISAVPPRPGKPFDLPSLLAEGLAARRDLSDITKFARRQMVKKSVKDASIEEKWDLLLESDLQYDVNVRGANVLIIDDIYQSGATLNYVASVLQKMEASQVLGVVVTKAMGNVDNS